MHYTSKDFDRTTPVLGVEVPSRLVHADVENTAHAAAFSAERKHPVSVVDLPSKTISVTIGGLEPGQTASKHRHTYETILYVLEGEGFTMVEERRVEWKAGDAVYIPAWAWHQHTNRSAVNRCKYVACENAPLMQNLNAALREEAP
ncbi:cupin domain-containing protein [Pendulispora rubella]|uniref:Cupin domain-containing protein n=1 Tax=Pendulispora rubella TaxID=2741070 RepID=A0ABZ2LNV1_9BACT